MSSGGLTHFNEEGAARMVDVSDKEITVRVAEAGASVWMKPETFQRVAGGTIAKGDVLAVARLAGIMAAKKTPDLIPLCHPIPIDSVDVEFTLQEDDSRVDIKVRAKMAGRTGIEMEALTGAAVAALTIYDMCKAIDRGMVIGNVRLLMKDGGRSGRFERA